MERDEILSKHKKMLGSLSCLPKKMLSVHDLDNATEFVLHELCNEGCFNLHKAAYFMIIQILIYLKGLRVFLKLKHIQIGIKFGIIQKPSLHLCKNLILIKRFVNFV